jgi:hypothetical protein
MDPKPASEPVTPETIGYGEPSFKLVWVDVNVGEVLLLNSVQPVGISIS